SGDLAALADDVLVPSRAVDQPRQPGAGLEAVDALDELDPLARAGVRNPFHRQLAIPGERGRDRERAAVADNSVLRVERLEPELAQPALIFRRSAVRQRLEQEHRDPGPVEAVEDLFDRRTACRLEDAEANAAAEVTTTCRRPTYHKRTADFLRPETR